MWIRAKIGIFRCQKGGFPDHSGPPHLFGMKNLVIEAISKLVACLWNSNFGSCKNIILLSKMAVFQLSRRNVPLDMLNFWALKVLVFKFLGSNMVFRIKENGFKPKTTFLKFDFCTPLGAVCSGTTVRGLSPICLICFAEIVDQFWLVH